MSVFDIKDQVVVITGGTGVLGREIGTYLAHEGARVVLLGRRQDVGEALAEGIRAQGGDAAFYVCDVTDMEMVNGVRDQIVDRYGRVDALLNAAGGNMPGATIPPGKTLFDVQVEEFERVLNVNLTGTLIPTQAFLKPMTEAGHGSIVNFSSMAAFRPLTRVMGYAAAKAGISNLTAFLANEVATKFSPSIRVHAIAPGFFLTDQNRFLLTDEQTGELKPRGRKIIANTPTHKFGEPEDLVGTMLYLLSDISSFVTGVIIPVDGGYSAFGGV